MIKIMHKIFPLNFLQGEPLSIFLILDEIYFLTIKNYFLAKKSTSQYS